MKTRISALVLALTLVFSISASAATRTNNTFLASPGIKATSRGVICTMVISSADTSLTVSGTITLYKDNAYVTSWSVSGRNISKTYPQVSSGTYRMEFDLTIKGVDGTDYFSGSDEVTY